VLVGERTGVVVRVESGIGIVLENFAVVGAPSREMGAGVIELHNVVACELVRLGVLSPTQERLVMAGIALSGYLLRLSVRECIVAAPLGIAGGQVNEKRVLTLAMAVDVTDSMLVCAQRGVSFDRNSLHYAYTTISDNLIGGCREAGVVSVGASLPGTSVTVRGNTIYAQGYGVALAPDGATVTDNLIVGTPAGRELPADGISLIPGIHPAGITHARIIGNRILRVSAHGISVRTRVRSGLIKQNQIDGVTGGGIIMDDKASAEHLVVDNNQLVRIGASFNTAGATIAGIRLLGVARADVVNNVLDQVARDAIQARVRHGIHVLAGREVRVAGNRLRAIGPAVEFAGEAIGIEIHPAFDTAEVVDNTIFRAASTDLRVEDGRWTALRIHRDERRGFIKFTPNVAWVGTRLVAAVFGHGHLWVGAGRTETVAARGNQARSPAGGAFLVDLTTLGTCIFSDNRCEQSAGGGESTAIVLLSADRLLTSTNSVRGPADQMVMAMQSDGATVLGNVTNGAIYLNSNPLDLPWSPLNVIAP
jgi:hypothetical protein